MKRLCSPSQAAELLQSAMRAHRYRRTNLHHWEDDDGEEMTEEVTDTMDDSDLDSAAQVVQGSYQNYKQQKGFIRYCVDPSSPTLPLSLFLSVFLCVSVGFLLQ